MMNQAFPKWILSQSKELNLRVQEATWTREWIPDFYSMHSSIEVGGQKILGHGLDRSQEKAFVKSAAEAIERAFCIENNLHTSGIAAFTEFEEAQSNASFELKERDLFLCHHLTQIPFVNFLEISGFDKAITKLKELKITIRALQMNAPENEYGVACFAVSENEKYDFSTLIGLGYGNNLKQSLEKAFLECLESTVNFITHPEKIRAMKPRVGSSLWHKMLYLHPNYKEFISEFSQTTQKQFILQKPLEIEHEQLFSRNPIFKNLPLYIVKAISAQTQNLFYGDLKEERINYQRLTSFTGFDVSRIHINLIPHCIG